MKRHFIPLLIVGILTGQALSAKDAYWPRVIRFSQGTITLYQPQPESLDGNNLHGRAAVMIKQKKEGAPVFGAFWFDANIFTDRDERMVTMESISISSIKFPEEIDAAREQEIRSILEAEIPKMSLEFQLDELLATIEESNSGKTGEEGLNNEPPEIIVRNNPAVLITIDGEPRTEVIEGSDIQQVVNTPYFIAFDPQNREYWLYGDGMWFVTTDVLRGTWRYEKNPRPVVKDLIDESENTTEGQVLAIPEVVVRTSPAELIVTEGEPDFAPIEGSSLLYVRNTQSDVFMNTNNQSYYILLSGRWYISKSMKGPWVYVPADQLPQEFSAIPEGSSKDRVLASVAGTDAANEAVLDAIIPQTASVKRNEATVEVIYDGNPNFVNIPGTRVAYADNSGTTVLLINNRFYACDNGIWFESDRATGPWMVSVNVPDDVQDIPPSSPVHNVKYVYVYDYTPDIVYVGYTPGYTGCYVYGPTVVYGTGFRYHSWYGAHYYPRPWTYGYHMYYDPYMGWVIGFYTPYWNPYSWYTCYYYHPHYRYHYYGGYWGPPAYPPPYHHHYHHYYGPHPVHPVAYRENPRNSPPQNVYYQHRTGVETNRRVMGPSEASRSSLNTRRTEAGTRTSTQTSTRRSDPAQQTGRTTTTRTSTDTRSTTGRTTTRQSTRNNVYTDKEGDVYRRTDQEWQKRENNTWQPAPRQSTTQPSTTPTTRPTTTTRPASTSTQRSDLDRQQYSRERGEQRSSNARATRSTPTSRSSTTKPADNSDASKSKTPTTTPTKR
ncbi:MAG: hypothetical protein A2Y87_10550 [Bacteroidetes bacterium RBG_13_46_8]|nr:MAG: hypothetical protein A2Y87_10550 [Bacteroidetes bacterium RBG_13_46_8]